MRVRWLRSLLVLAIVASPRIDADTTTDGTTLVRGGTFRMDRDEVTNARFAAFVTAHTERSRERIPPALHG